MIGKSHYRVRGVTCGKCEKIHQWYKYRVWRDGGKIKEEYIGKCDKYGNIHAKTSSKHQRPHRTHAKRYWWQNAQQERAGYHQSNQHTYTNPRPYRSPYEILGISSVATAQEIKQAYRRLVKQYHPDRNKHIDPRLIVEITTAYHTLMK